MYIQSGIKSISDNFAHKLSFKSNRQTKNNPKQTNAISKTMPVCYPANYYISFKGNNNQDFKSLESIAEEIYEENKGQSPYSYSCGRITPSRQINKDFAQMIIYQMKRKPVLSEEQITDGFSSCLEGMLCTEKNPAYQSDPESYREKIRGQVKDSIKQYKEREGIEGKLSADVDSLLFHYLKIGTSKILSSEAKNIGGSNREIIERFRSSVTDFMERSDKSKVDENFLARVKEELQQDPFRTYSLKMKKIKEQEELNGGYNPDECAQEIYEDFINKKISPFENKKLYDFITKNDEKLDFLLEKIHGVGKKTKDAEFEKTGIDARHKVLLVDPGIVAHLNEMEDFIRKNHINTAEMEPFELRSRFSEYLGNETIYRGLNTNKPEELKAKIMRDGNFAPVCRNKEKAIEAIKYYIDINTAYSDTLYGRITDRIKGQNPDSEFLSATSIYAIAGSVPKKFIRDGEHVLIIEQSVPRLNLIKQEGDFHNMQINSIDRRLWIGDSRYDYNTEQDKIESFIPFYIPASNNMKITIDDSLPEFHWDF